MCVAGLGGGRAGLGGRGRGEVAGMKDGWFKSFVLVFTLGYQY